MNHLGPDMKFIDPEVTAKGETRARVGLTGLRTLWFNTGSLCNIECAHCYMESGPRNDALVYLTAAEVARFLDEAAERHPELTEVGFTGGEPFMNRDIVAMLGDVLGRGLSALVLTNAMQPLTTKRAGLAALNARYGARLRLRVSLDHYTATHHDAERGPTAWDKTMEGLAWLRDEGFAVDIAGRTLWGEDETTARAGYAALFARLGLDIDAADPGRLVLFPEMDPDADVPEITTSCWKILDKSPDEVMCASSRMVVKHKGEAAPTVAPCTLLPYDRRFSMGATLADAGGEVPLNHPYCAAFCVLGGGACSR